MITDPTQTLSTLEANRLTACESCIAHGIGVFLDVGNALLEIRDARLYRQQFATFEMYCKERWGMVRRHANRLIQAAEVVHHLGPIGPIPTTESQARPLTKLEPEVQREVWREVTDTALLRWFLLDLDGIRYCLTHHAAAVDGWVESRSNQDGATTFKALHVPAFHSIYPEIVIASSHPIAPFHRLEMRP